MIPLHVTHADHLGGAAIAARRLHDGLRRIGTDSHMLVLNKHRSDDSVFTVTGLGANIMRQPRSLRGLPTRLYPRRDRSAPWSANWLPYTRRWAALQADVINLHWIGINYLPIASWASLPHPVVWTLHDSWAFTGGCHIPHDCRRYEERCGACPILGSRQENDLSRWTWHAKARAIPKMQPVIVAPSLWLADCARRSSLLRQSEIHIIPHGLDLTVFRPVSQLEARAALGLPAERSLIAFGAMWALDDPNKGADLLSAALKSLTADAHLLIFGADQVPAGLTRPAYALGTLNDEQRSALVYAAADVMVVPSRSENLPLTVLESLACGTPVVAFRVGGIPDLIEHQVNGYLAEPFDTADLARGIAWVLENPERHARLRAAARAKAEREYELTHIARRYLALYEDILSRPK